MARAWPLTGRSEEFGFIVAAMRRQVAPRGVVVAGAAGVGKTRLAREALAASERQGTTTWWVAATESARRLPLGAFASVLGAVVEDPTGVLRRACDELVAGAGRGGVVVGVDDVHLLDDLSALLLHQLVVRRQATVVVTMRTGETVPDALTALWKDEHLDRLEVQALSETETVSLLEAALGGPMDSVAARRMWKMTRGNALFLRLLVDGELEAGRLEQAHGFWRWIGEPVISPALAELLEIRMGQLSQPVRDVVDVLALGEPLDVAVLAGLTEPSSVEQAEAAGLLHVGSNGGPLEARLAHPLYGEVRRERLGRVRARRLHGEIAVALADPSVSSAMRTLRRAVLALDSDLEPDPQLFAMAARSASALVDLPLAERLARASVAAGGGFEPRFALAYILSFSSRGAEADVVLAELGVLASNDMERALVGLAHAAHLFWTMGRPDEAEAVLGRAEAVVVEDTDRRPLIAMRAAFEAALGRADQALQSAAKVVGTHGLHPMATVPLSFGLVTALGVLGRADEMGSVAARGQEAAASSEVAYLRFGLAHLHVGGLRLAGYLHEAETVARDCRRASLEMPGKAQLYGIVVAGYGALARGQVQSALHALREARTGLGPFEPQGFGFVCLLHLTEALALAGESAAARRALADLEAERHPSFVFLDPDVVLAAAWVAAAEGGSREGDRPLATGRRRCPRSGTARP